MFIHHKWKEPGDENGGGDTVLAQSISDLLKGGIVRGIQHQLAASEQATPDFERRRIK